MERWRDGNGGRKEESDCLITFSVFIQLSHRHHRPSCLAHSLPSTPARLPPVLLWTRERSIALSLSPGAQTARKSPAPPSKVASNRLFVSHHTQPGYARSSKCDPASPRRKMCSAFAARSNLRWTRFSCRKAISLDGFHRLVRAPRHSR